MGSRGQYHMKREQSGPFLSAVFVDYDNIYLSLKRKNEEASKRFAKDALGWVKRLETGDIITSANGGVLKGQRRIVMNRCYGNPVPRRNASDNSTDMSSFPFVRHHFLRAGFEVVDCPPLTAQLKNSADIRMVMDLRDYLSHETHFDEFVILSGDADFTPVLHRLRAHARRTVIYATDYTAAPYTAISDGEVREADLITLLMEGRVGGEATGMETPALNLEATRRAIIEDVVTTVRASGQPVPLEVLADRAVRAIGHEQTIGTAWAGSGGFRELLTQGLPQGFRLSGEPPYVVIDTQRHVFQSPAAQMLQVRPGANTIEPVEQRPERSRPIAPAAATPEIDAFNSLGLLRAQAAPVPQSASPQAPVQQQAVTIQPRRQPVVDPAPVQLTTETAAPTQQQSGSGIHQSIARIYEACKAPPLAPPEYRMLFELIALEINENGLIGAQTIHNIAQRAQDRGIDVRRDDVRFILEVVSEADPWFEQGASPNLFAGRFRNFVVARCRAQGLTLSADELDLIEAWFAGNAQPAQGTRQAPPAPTFAAAPPPRPVATAAAEPTYWPAEDTRQQVGDTRLRTHAAAHEGGEIAADDFPRIVRTRLRG